MITGGSSGIGAAAVRRFAAAGDRVWFTYRSGHDRAQALLERVRGAGGEAEAFYFDQGDLTSHRNLMAALPGRVDVLVNNAGLGSKTVEQYAPDSPHSQDEALLRVNALGPMWLTQDILGGMLKQGSGKVLFVGSVGGSISQVPGFRISDAMSKAAIAYLTRHLAAELVHTPIDVIAVCPGAVETPMLEASALADLGPEERAQLKARLPKGRLITPEEIAELLWWLSTAPGTVLNGAVIDASMGLGVRTGLLTER